MMLNKKELQALCNVASTAARVAGEYIQSKVNQHYGQKRKEGGDSLASQVVTEVDIKSQEIILRHLEASIKQYDLGLLTEESTDDQSRLDKSYFWCIDPMDGTLPFTEGRSGYAVSVALVAQSGDPVIGVAYVPDEQLCYAGFKSGGVRLNDQPFQRQSSKIPETLDVFMDRSMREEPYFEWLKDELEAWTAKKNQSINLHIGFGAVRNALGVMNAEWGCYFKFPKAEVGGGSSWDFAATRLLFEEAGLHVSDTFGQTIKLNRPENTFMHETGVIYATESELAAFIQGLSKMVTP